MLEYDHARFVRYSGLLPHVYKRAMRKKKREEAAAKARAEAEKALEDQKRRDKLALMLAEIESAKAARAEQADQFLVSLASGVKISPRNIIAAVAATHGIPVEEIMGDSRRKHVVAARHEAMLTVVKHRPDLAISHVGRIFRRDHTVVLYVLNKYADSAKQGGSHV